MCFLIVDFETPNSKLEVSKSKYFFLEIYVTSEGVVSYNVLYHQPLPINTRYQVRFDANNDSATAFKYPHRLYVKISFLHG